MSSLNLQNVLDLLARRYVDAEAIQVTDPSRREYGGIFPPGARIAESGYGGTVGFMTAGGYLYLAAAGAVGQGQLARPADVAPRPLAQMAEELSLAAGCLLAVQRPTGLIDLPSANYDSSPDAGFVVQMLCTLLELGQGLAKRDRAWAAYLAQVETFIRRATPAMASGGFHTPNHRWVMSSAMAQAHAVLPDLDVEPWLSSYLAEGIDITSEGNYIERSPGIYDAVCDRSLLFLHELCGYDALPAIRSNLEWNLHLLHADGTIETGLSRRQDYGTAPVPVGLVPCYLHAGTVLGEPRFISAAQWLWDRDPTHNNQDANWLTYALLKSGDPQPSTAALPEQFVAYYPQNGLWRHRNGLLSVSAFSGATRLLDLRFGAAELAAVKISQSYFGVGRFVGNTLATSGDSVTLHSTGRSDPRRPAYEQPLGHPVPPERYFDMLAERQQRLIPLCASELTVTPVEGGVDLHYRTVDGMEGVTAQVALDFAPGGVWETDDTALTTLPGQTLFLKRGYGAMRCGVDTITIGPGVDQHRTWQMRDTELAPGHARVLLAFLTPVDHVIQLRCRRGA